MTLWIWHKSLEPAEYLTAPRRILGHALDIARDVALFQYEICSRQDREVRMHNKLMRDEWTEKAQYKSISEAINGTYIEV
jgi:hypothetical protein